MSDGSVSPPVVLVRWERTLQEILGRTEKMPRKVRFTLSSRIDNLALDILERLIEARYRRPRGEALRQANLSLEKLRVLLRICHEQQYLSTPALEHLTRDLDEVGRMMGGWLRAQEARGDE